MFRTETNVITGESTVIQLTPEEIAATTSAIPPTYAELRVMEYPPYADYLDAIVKGDQVQLQTYIDACLAVKAKYPKV